MLFRSFTLFWVCGFLYGEGLLCGSSLFSLGSMVAAVVVSTGLRLLGLHFAGCDVTLRLFRSKIFYM